jgi:hypothetical protein
MKTSCEVDGLKAVHWSFYIFVSLGYDLSGSSFPVQTSRRSGESSFGFGFCFVSALLIADPHFGKSTLPDLSTEAVFLPDTKRKSALYQLHRSFNRCIPGNCH